MIAPGCAMAALVAVLTPAGLVWLAPALAAAAVLAWRAIGTAAVGKAISLAVAVAVMSLPVLGTGKTD